MSNKKEVHNRYAIADNERLPSYIYPYPTLPYRYQSNSKLDARKVTYLWYITHHGIINQRRVPPVTLSRCPDKGKGSISLSITVDPLSRPRLPVDLLLAMGGGDGISALGLGFPPPSLASRSASMTVTWMVVVLTTPRSPAPAPAWQPWYVASLGINESRLAVR